MYLKSTMTAVAAFVLPFGLLASGCAQPPGGGQGSQSVSVPTGDAGSVNVVTDEPSQGVAAAELPQTVPSGARSARVSVDAANVQFVDAAGKTQALMQGEPRQADVTIHVAGEDAADPCADEFQVLSFTASEDPQGILLSDATASLSSSSLALVLSGRFVFCIQIVANFSGSVIISDIDFDFGGPAGNDDASTNGDDDGDNDDVDDGEENDNDDGDDGDVEDEDDGDDANSNGDDEGNVNDNEDGDEGNVNDNTDDANDHVEDNLNDNAEDDGNLNDNG